jgi:hypothetical protein
MSNSTVEAYFHLIREELWKHVEADAKVYPVTLIGLSATVCTAIDEMIKTPLIAIEKIMRVCMSIYSAYKTQDSRLATVHKAAALCHFGNFLKYTVLTPISPAIGLLKGVKNGWRIFKHPCETALIMQCRNQVAYYIYSKGYFQDGYSFNKNICESLANRYERKVWRTAKDQLATMRKIDPTTLRSKNIDPTALESEINEKNTVYRAEFQKCSAWLQQADVLSSRLAIRDAWDRFVDTLVNAETNEAQTMQFTFTPA